MAYKMKGFSGFGNSPLKQKTTKSDTVKTYPKSYTKEDIKFLEEQHEDVVRYEDLDAKGKAIWDARRKGKAMDKLFENKKPMKHVKRPKTKSPTGQWKGTEGQDQDKIFDSKGNHIGDWVNDKKVMHKIPSDDNRPRKSPAKQTDTTYANGTKKSAREQAFSKRYTAEKAKEKYWYKINNKPATKAEYMKYQNKPGGDEPGKQTNDPNVSLAKISADKRTKINK